MFDVLIIEQRKAFKTPSGKAVVLLLLIHCLLWLPLFVGGGGRSGFVPCFIMQYLVSFRILQSSLMGKESCIFDFNGIPGVL